MPLLSPLPRDIFAHFINSSVALLRLEAELLDTGRTRVGATGLDFVTCVIGRLPLVERGPRGVVDDGLGFPPAPTVVQAPEVEG